MGISYSSSPSDHQNKGNTAHNFDAKKIMEQRITFTEILRELKSNVSVDVIIAFENFLKEQDIDEKIESGADHHRFPGSADAYRNSMQEVTEEYFLDRSVSAVELMKIHGHLFTFNQNKKFRDRISTILRAEEMKGIPNENTQMDQKIIEKSLMEGEFLDTAQVFSEKPVNISPKRARLLNDIENLHIDEIPEEEIDQYTMKNSTERLSYWEHRLFSSDPLYNRIKVSK